MKKLFITLLITSVSFSQELVKEFNFKLAKKTDVFQVVEAEKKQISLFFSDKRNVRTLRFDESFKFKLQKFSNSKFKKELLDEVILDYEEIQNEFEVGNETIEKIERQKVEDNIITTEIKVFVPEKKEVSEVEINDEFKR